MKFYGWIFRGRGGNRNHGILIGGVCFTAIGIPLDIALQSQPRRHLAPHSPVNKLFSSICNEIFNSGAPCTGLEFLESPSFTLNFKYIYTKQRLLHQSVSFNLPFCFNQNSLNLSKNNKKSYKCDVQSSLCGTGVCSPCIRLYVTFQRTIRNEYNSRFP